MLIKWGGYMDEVLNQFLYESIKSLLQFGGLGACIYALNKLIRERKITDIDKYKQTNEDRSCSTHIIGIPGSGKTYFAMWMFIRDIEKGKGALWLSTQGISNSDMLNYIPKHRINDVILLRPYAKRPRGINILRTYTNSELERTLVADSVVVLFKRLFENFGDNMEGILTSSVLALLEYAEKTNEKVSLWDLYIFLTDENYRMKVINRVENKIALDMLNETYMDKKVQTSLHGLLRRMRKLLYHDQMVAFLSRKDDDVDLLEAVKQNKVIICDFLAGGVGSEGIGKQNSSFLAELIVSKMQLISETRNINSPLFPLYLDEFQTYTSTSDNIKDFIDLNRQRRMPIILINQRRYQLSKELQDAVDACGTRFIMKVNSHDINHYKKMYPQFEEEIEKFKARDCLCDIRCNGKNYRFITTTPDIGEKVNLGHIIEKNNIGKYTTKEIIENMLFENEENEIIDKSLFQ